MPSRAMDFVTVLTAFNPADAQLARSSPMKTPP